MEDARGESCQMATAEDDGVDDDSPVVGADDQQDQRLRELLDQLLRSEGRMKAAETLGVGYRTLVRAVEGEELSRRTRLALERLLLARQEAEAARDRERMQTLAQGMAALGEEVHAALQEVRSVGGEMAALREEYEQVVRGLERRVAEVESRLDERGDAAAKRANGSKGGGAAAARKPRREHPDLVTWEPAPDDEAVFGVAWPLVEEWRRLWVGHKDGGKGLPWLVTEERIRELEVAMLEEHGLTLPPEKEPLRGMWRSSQLGWRQAVLEETRRERAKRERMRRLRRALTLGLWWE